MVKRWIPVLLLALLCGCAAPAPTRQETRTFPAAEPVAAPARAALAVEESVPTTPYDCLSSVNRLICSLLYEPLFRVTAAGEPKAVLAESWRVSDDGETTTVILRSGLRFSDGTALTAEAAAASLRRAENSAVYGGRMTHITALEAQGQTLTLHTELPCRCLPLLLDVPVTVSGGEDTLLGTGPYARAGMKLERNPYWRGQDFPLNTETVELIPVTDPEGLWDSFQYGEVSMVETDPNSGAQPALRGDYELWSVPTTILQYIGFQTTTGAFRDGGLRCALCRMVDREAIVAEDLGGFGVAVNQAALPGTDAFVPGIALSEPESDTFRAAAAGKHGKMIVCGASLQRVASARRVAKEMNACGMEVTVSVLDAEAYAAALRAGDFDLYYGEIRLPPDQNPEALFTPGSGACFGGLALPHMQELCRDRLADSAGAQALQTALYTDGLICPVAFKTRALYVRRGLLRDPAPGLSGWLG